MDLDPLLETHRSRLYGTVLDAVIRTGTDPLFSNPNSFLMPAESGDVLSPAAYEAYKWVFKSMCWMKMCFELTQSNILSYQG